MTITPHILTGAAVASFLPTGSDSMRLVGFLLGFISHYILDAIPHWERLYGPHYNDELPDSYSKWPRHVTLQGLADTLIGCSVFLTILVVIVPGPSRAIVFLGGIGAVLPDFMDNVPLWAARTKRLPIWRYFGRLHDQVHISNDLQRRLPSFLGIVSQLAVVMTAVLVLILHFR